MVKIKNRFIEEDLAEVLVKTFNAAGYVTFNEVCIKGGGTNRCDIYAVMNEGENRGLSMVIETKMSLNLKVIEQAYFWKQHAHYAYIGILKQKRRKDRKFGAAICTALGLGMIEVDLWNKKIDIIVKAVINNNPSPPTLFNEQRMSVAGNSSNEYVTPFKITCANLKKYLEENGDTVFSKAVKSIKHHYGSDASACSSLGKHVRNNVLPGVKIVYKNKQPVVSYDKTLDTSIQNNENNERTDYRKDATDL